MANLTLNLNQPLICKACGKVYPNGDSDGLCDTYSCKLPLVPLAGFVSYRRKYRDNSGQFHDNSIINEILRKIEIKMDSEVDRGNLPTTARLFFDRDGLESRAKFTTQIGDVIKSLKGRYLVLLLTPGALDKRGDSEEDWMRNEIKYAQEHNLIILPIEWHTEGASFKWPLVDVNDPFHDSLKELSEQHRIVWYDRAEPADFQKHIVTPIIEFLTQKEPVHVSPQPTETPISVALSEPAPAAPAWNLETPFASLIETHFAKFPDLIPLAKHITSGWTYGVEVQSQVGNYIELHTNAGLAVDFDADDKELMWMGLGIGLDGQSLVLLSSPSSCVSSYDDEVFESDDCDSNTQQWLRMLGWKSDFVKNPTLLDALGQELPMDECIGMVVPKSDSTRISESVAVIKNDAWEAQWIAENEREYDDNNLLDSCRVYLMEPMNTFLLRSPALLETFAVYFHEVCKGEKECNSKFSKNNDRFLSLNKKDMQPMDIYVDQVAHMSYLILRKNGASISTPRLSDSKNIKTYLASAGWKWEIQDQVTTREKGEAGETRVETDLVALPIKLYDVDYTAKVEALKRIVREYGADVQG